MIKNCNYCKLRERYKNGKILYGKDFATEYTGEFGIRSKKESKEYYLYYRDNETHNATESIKYCPMCGKKIKVRKETERLTERTDDGILLKEGLDIHVETPEDIENLQIILKKLADYEDTDRTSKGIHK